MSCFTPCACDTFALAKSGTRRDRSPSTSPRTTPRLSSAPHSNVGLSVFALDPIHGHVHERTRRRDRVDARGKAVWTEGDESVTDIDTDAEVSVAMSESSISLHLDCSMSAICMLRQNV